ncbi:hypothetical protein VTK73DRAFT_3579 [Phialemonium thermophilum]|uniref:Zn(2)-C6 fungal-type domain-containing protein n=1 Tax=Phialemonium thermophilum TaxID=223376 RepID=A0ABR3WYS8_9PEZI
MTTMSPDLSEVDVKPFADIGLDFPPSVPDTDPAMAQSVSPVMHASGDGLGTAIAAPHCLLDSTHFGDFDFSYQDLAEPESLVDFKDQSADVFPTTSQPPSMSSVPDLQDATATITVQTSTFGGISGPRGASLDASDDGSPDSNGHGANPLDDPMADEFGLSTGEPGDGTDLGSKAKGDKPDTTPAWSELKTKAGKERKRLPLACIACRRKKIRCSGEKPACKHCLRSRIPCVYKVTARKAAPRTDYMAMLDKRLKRMEERIIKIVPKSEQDSVSASVTRAVVKPSIPGTLTNAKSTAKKRGADDAFGADLDHWARAPSRSRIDGPDRPVSLLAQEEEESKLLLEGSEALPSKEIQEHLAEVFFENIYGQAYHLLHRPSFMRKLRAGTVPPVLILSICAVSARFSNHPKLNTNPQFLRGEEWASVARDILTKRYEWPNITILTCLLIMGLHEFGTCHGGRSWALGGQAIRMAFALQLHKDLEYDPQRLNGRTQLSFIDREIRRRTMWSCFLMDRFNSSGTDRPTFIREETLKIPLPIKEKYFQLDMPGPTEDLSGQVLHPVPTDEGQLADAKENMGVAAYTIRVIALWGRIISYLNQGGKDLDPHPMWSPDSEYAKLIKQTEDFSANLPEPLVYTPENLQLHDTENMANQFLFLHIAIQQNILFMNRFAVSSPSGGSQQNVPKTFVTKAGARAFQAANRISELLKDAETHFITAPFTGYCAFLSSTVHIFGIFSGNQAMEATSKRNLATNVKFLSKMKRYWGMFHWMAENLREQYRTCADAARQGNPANENATSPIFQYGDWFDRYPHGVEGSDYVDPASYKKKEKGEDAVLEQKPELHTVEEYFTSLSPGSTEAANNTARSGPQLKRKSVARKGSAMARSDQPQMDAVSADFAAHRGSLQHHHRRTYSASGGLSGQTSGAGSFNPLAVAHSANGNPFPGLSPLSPVSVSQFAAAHRHHPAAAAFFSPDPFSIPLAAHPGSMALPQLDRQLVFGAYGSGIENGLGSLAGWGADGESSRHGGSDGGRQGSQASGGQDPEAALHAAFGQEASSAWFMPFNMEPPDLGTDLGMGGLGALDGFVNMFGSGGLQTPNGGLGNLHRGSR